ncbi:HAAS signaling domain-containing protein [Listeria cornellensis]|uniref:HAAS signaling domain-containing protein n=1 Tax=Listeria cornellensis TaxID=1494961 RepID=UPI00098D5DAD
MDQIFFETLHHGLRSLPEDERASIIKDLDEHIAISLENGISEVDAIALLGDPNDIIEQYVQGAVVVPKRVQQPVIQKALSQPEPPQVQVETKTEKPASKQISPFKIVLIAGMCFIILMLLLDALD